MLVRVVLVASNLPEQLLSRHPLFKHMQFKPAGNQLFFLKVRLKTTGQGIQNVKEGEMGRDRIGCGNVMVFLLVGFGFE